MRKKEDLFLCSSLLIDSTCECVCSTVNDYCLFEINRGREREHQGKQGDIRQNCLIREYMDREDFNGATRMAAGVDWTMAVAGNNYHWMLDPANKHQEHMKKKTRRVVNDETVRMNNHLNTRVAISLCSLAENKRINIDSWDLLTFARGF